MSIIDSKYAGKYRGEGDWLSKFIKAQCYDQPTKTVDVKNEAGEVTGTDTVPAGKPVLNVDSLFDLAAVNGIDARGKYADQADQKNAPGRLRMTVGNMLRAASKKRHGLYDIDKGWNDADAEFLGADAGEPTETRDGERIKPVKAAPEGETTDTETQEDAA